MIRTTKEQKEFENCVELLKAMSPEAKADAMIRYVAEVGAPMVMITGMLTNDVKVLEKAIRGHEPYTKERLFASTETKEQAIEIAVHAITIAALCLIKQKTDSLP